MIDGGAGRAYAVAMNDATPSVRCHPLPRTLLALWLTLLLAGCGADGGATAADPGAGTGQGAANSDAGADSHGTAGDAGAVDGGQTDAATADAGGQDGATGADDANPVDTWAERRAAFVPTAGHEHALGGGWIGAGQPSQARLKEVVALGARVLSLRVASEDPFDEEALVEAAGGTFIRYPVVASKYYDKPFREALYDLYDAQHEEGGLVYLHCASSNRVGASWALYQAERKNVPVADAIALGKAAGMTGLTQLVEEILGVK